MTLTELIASVRAKSGYPSTDAQITDAAITDFLNDALNAISTERDWPWLETSATLTTVADTAAYSPPSGWVRTRALQVPGSAPMDGAASRFELDSLYPSTSTGQPQSWVVSGDQIRLYPIPDGVYSITHIYFRQETQLSSPTDEPLMPAWAHAAIVHWATSLCHSRTRNQELADESMKRARDWLTRLADNARRSNGPYRVRVRPGSPV